MSKKSKSTETENRLAVNWGLGGNEKNCKWAQGSYWGDENVLELDCGDGCTTW